MQFGVRIESGEVLSNYFNGDMIIIEYYEVNHEKCDSVKINSLPNHKYNLETSSNCNSSYCINWFIVK